MLQWFPLSIKHYNKPSHIYDFVIALRKKNIVHLWDACNIIIIHIVRAIFSGNFISSLTYKLVSRILNSEKDAHNNYIHTLLIKNVFHP